MKKILLLNIALFLCFAGIARKVHSTHSSHSTKTAYSNENNLHTGRTTAIGDTLILSNISVGDSLVLYTLGANDSNGYVTGTDSAGDEAFAERYDVSGSDSSLVVIGVMAQFGGTVNPSSLKTINFNVWNEGMRSVITATQSYSGFPNNVLDSLTVPVTALGIGIAADTVKTFLFPVPTFVLQNNFFVGYNINYNFSELNGDTIGLSSSVNGSRRGVAYTASVNTTTLVTPLGDTTITSFDTVINVRNATRGSDNNWYDNYTQNDSLFNDLAIFPIVVIRNPTGIKVIANKSFALYGCYPDPATNDLYIKYALNATASITIQIMDMAGHTLNIIPENNLCAGEHITLVNTAKLATGDYLYLLRTSTGDGAASKFSVVR